jgi:hypothetical protein
MSIQALVWVIEYSRSRLADRCVLVSIANHCDREGKNAWPSVDTVSHEAKVSTRQAQVSIARLCRLGELRVEKNRGPHGTNLYGLPLMTEGKPSLLAVTTQARTGGAESAGVQNLRGAESSAETQILAQQAQNSAPEPSLESSLEPSVSSPLAPDNGASRPVPPRVNAAKHDPVERKSQTSRSAKSETTLSGEPQNAEPRTGEPSQSYYKSELESLKLKNSVGDFSRRMWRKRLSDEIEAASLPEWFRREAEVWVRE